MRSLRTPHANQFLTPTAKGARDQIAACRCPGDRDASDMQLANELTQLQREV